MMRLIINCANDSAPELIEAQFQRLCPDNMLVFVVAKDFEGATTEVEPVYKTQYAVSKFTAEFIEV